MLIHTCLAEPFAKRSRRDKDPEQGQGEFQRGYEAEGLSRLWLIFGLLLKSAEGENSSISGSSQAGTRSGSSGNTTSVALAKIKACLTSPSVSTDRTT